MSGACSSCAAPITAACLSGRCRACSTLASRRSVPDDFAIHAAIETRRQLAARYRAGPDVIKRWSDALGVERKPAGKMPRPAPADLATQAQSRSIRALSDHYEVSREMVTRWCRETGVAPADMRRPRTSAAGTRFQRHMHPIATERSTRDTSQAGAAADYLRRLGPVYRCNEAGQPAVAGRFWRRGTAILTDAELIERAEWMRGREQARAA